MKTYDDFFASLPGAEQSLVCCLRDIVLDTFPDFREKLSYGVPYYFHRSRVCFIWPASVRYGPPSGVLLGLCRGHLLSNEQGLLIMGKRKEVALITFLSTAEIDGDAIREIIEEAIIVDEQMAGR